MATRIDTLERRHLYVEYLAARLQAYECADLPMRAVGYRLFARRLREAAEEFADVAPSRRAALHPLLLQALQDRAFELRGQLSGPGAAMARRAAAKLFKHLTAPKPSL